MSHPSLRAGRRRTQIELLTFREEQEEEFGTMVRRWVPVMTAMAEVQDMLPSRTERVAEAIDLSLRRSRIRMLRREGVVPTMRVKIGDQVMRIIAGPALIGRRRDGLELVVEEHSTEGEES